MHDCSQCEDSLSESAPLKIYLTETNNTFHIYAQNRSRNIIIIKRILLCREWTHGGQTINFIRESDFLVGGETLEPDGTHLKYRASSEGAISANAQAEYIEITGRSRSCELTL